MSGNRDETVRQFCDVTGADENRSKFFLESSNWQLEEAISSFYEHGGNVDEAPTQATPAPPLPTLSDSDMESPPDSPQRQKKEKKKPDTKFATLTSLQPDNSSSDEEEDVFGWIPNKVRMIVEEHFCTKATCSKNTKDCKCMSCKEEINDLMNEIEDLTRENNELREEIARLKASIQDEGQAFYAGGSERSGQQILGPSKGRKDIVTEVFKSVKERGAVVFEDEPTSSGRGRGVFGGTGYRLGQTADDHEPVTPAGAQQSQANEPRSVRLRLYREGFSVDSGPMRSYTDPSHAEFLNYIRRGEIPPELSGGGEVRVSLEDRRHEECPKHMSKAQPFTGKGHLLGSPTPATVGGTAAVAAAPADREANQRAAQDSLNVDTSQPTTTLQFRLADGQLLTGTFNHSHTVSDLARYVLTAVPLYQVQPFSLHTSYPSRELADPAQTIAAANLANSTLLQRLK